MVEQIFRLPHGKRSVIISYKLVYTSFSRVAKRLKNDSERSQTLTALLPSTQSPPRNENYAISKQNNYYVVCITQISYFQRLPFTLFHFLLTTANAPLDPLPHQAMTSPKTVVERTGGGCRNWKQDIILGLNFFEKTLVGGGSPRLLSGP